ncbi:hypothetical protein BH23CHL5_BH23CHL5_01220 [soil metagenome]
MSGEYLMSVPQLPAGRTFDGQFALNVRTYYGNREPVNVVE